MQAKDFYIDGLVQDCSISIANALEILQSCPKPSIYPHYQSSIENMISPVDNKPENINDVRAA